MRNPFKKKTIYVVYIWLAEAYVCVCSSTDYTKAFSIYDYFAWTETGFWTETESGIKPPKIREIV